VEHGWWHPTGGVSIGHANQLRRRTRAKRCVRPPAVLRCYGLADADTLTHTHIWVRTRDSGSGRDNLLEEAAHLRRGHADYGEAV
jgi:hypothetical protein